MIAAETKPQKPPISSSSPLSPQEAQRLGERVLQNVERVLLGKGEVVLHCLVGLAAKGHVLIEDVPGVGKSTAAHALARSLGLPFARVQFTSDLLPSDILGISTWDANEQRFVFRPGPIFHAVVLADEINRTPPRTQSALLEAMAERQVSLEGTTRELPEPFFVIATSNPREQQGTYPLPESQLDRFLLRLSLGYPAPGLERQLLVERRGDASPVELDAVATEADVLRLQAGVEQVRLHPSVADYILALAEKTREAPELSLGVSTRGALALAGASRALALLRGRDFVLPSDVQELAVPVLAHRLLPAVGQGDPHAGDRSWAESMLRSLLEQVPVPE